MGDHGKKPNNHEGGDLARQQHVLLLACGQGLVILIRTGRTLFSVLSRSYVVWQCESGLLCNFDPFFI
jgi:hypothetical protein